MKGSYSLVTFHWNDTKRRLTIGARVGSYPGMPNGHTFNIVTVKDSIGVGVEVSTVSNNVIEYSGKKAVVDF